METNAQKRLLIARESLRNEYRIKKARYDEVFMSASSASISSGGGSKSYSNHALSEMRNELARIAEEIRNINLRLIGRNTSGVRHVATIRS